MLRLIALVVLLSAGSGGASTYSMGAQWLSALNGSLGNDFGFGGRLFTSTVPNVREGVFGGALGNDFILTITADEIPPVPLPAGLPMLLAGLAGLGLLRRRQG